MGKALLGAQVSPKTLQLLDEVRALRARVALLEDALAQAEQVSAARLDADVVTLDAAPAAATA